MNVPVADRSYAAAHPRVVADAISKSRAGDIALVLAAAVMMAVLAQIEIPVPPSPVPISGQTLGVVLAGGLLGATRGSAAMLVYVLAGLALPVYAGGASGPSVLFGASGGYLVGFVFAAAAVGWLAENGATSRLFRAVVAFVVGQGIVFGIGVPWLMFVTGMEWATAIDQGFVIFIIGGLTKALVGAALVTGAWRLAR